MPWHVWLILTVVEATKLWSGQAGPMPDFKPQADAIVNRIVPDPNAGADARPAVSHALDVFAQLAREAGTVRDADGEPLVLDLTKIDREQQPNDLPREARLRELALASLDRFVERAGVARLAEAIDSPRVFVQHWDQDSQEYSFNELGQVRRVQRALGHVARRASERGEWDQYVQCVKARIVLTRFALGQPELMSRLVGMSLFREFAEDVQRELVLHRLPKGLCVQILAATRAVPWSDDVRPWIDLHGLYLHREIERCYTDDGHGNGHPILSTGAQLPLAATAFAAENLWTSQIPAFLDAIHGGAGNLLGMVMLDKRAAHGTIERFVASLKESSIRARPDRMPLPDWEKMSSSLPLAFHSQFMLHHASAAAKWLRYEDELRLRRAGLQLLLAIHVFHDEHGRYPDRLDELPEMQSHLAQHDPVSGRPMIYKSIDPARDSMNRSFLLYSIGADGVDNGGREPESSWMALDSRPQGDFVFNGKPEQRRP
jgi:hypothetical protein